MNRDEYIEHVTPVDQLLNAIARSIADASLPAMSVKAELGRLLTILAAANQTKKALEIGTFGGYSSICIARGLAKNGTLTTLEQRQEHANMAHANFKRAGVLEIVRIVVGDARASLEALLAQRETFDFIFIDADKPNYPKYLEYALHLSMPGTLIVADNIFVRDRVLDSNLHSPSTDAMRQFNQAVMNHPLLYATLLPIHDGFAVARVQENHENEI